MENGFVKINQNDSLGHENNNQIENKGVENTEKE